MAVNSLPGSAKYSRESKFSTSPVTRTASCGTEYMGLWRKALHFCRSPTRVMHLLGRSVRCWTQAFPVNVGRWNCASAICTGEHKSDFLPVAVRGTTLSGDQMPY